MALRQNTSSFQRGDACTNAKALLVGKRVLVIQFFGKGDQYIRMRAALIDTGQFGDAGYSLACPQRAACQILCSAVHGIFYRKGLLVAAHFSHSSSR